MARFFMITAALAGAVTVGFGALGSHYLEDLVTPSRYEVYQTGVLYLFFHVLILFITAKMAVDNPSRWLLIACIAFLTGMFLFSGSLVFLGVFGWRYAGAIAPFGGIAYITGWVSLAIASWNYSKQ